MPRKASDWDEWQSDSLELDAAPSDPDMTLSRRSRARRARAGAISEDSGERPSAKRSRVGATARRRAVSDESGVTSAVSDPGRSSPRARLRWDDTRDRQSDDTRNDTRDDLG